MAHRRHFHFSMSRRAPVHWASPWGRPQHLYVKGTRASPQKSRRARRAAFSRREDHPDSASDDNGERRGSDLGWPWTYVTFSIFKIKKRKSRKRNITCGSCERDAADIDRHPSTRPRLLTKYTSDENFSAAVLIDTYRKHLIIHVTEIIKDVLN